MRVLVTGASGFIGHAVTTHLLYRQHQVVGIGRRRAISGEAAQHLSMDIGAEGFVDNVTAQISPCDAIVHAAACISMKSDDPAISRTNCVGTQQVMALARLWGVRSLVYLSSLPVIGKPVSLPISEEHPVAPATTYHASKLYGEHLAAQLRTAGVKVATLRLTSPVGPGMPRDRIFSVFVKRALGAENLTVAGQGTRSQNYVDVRDVAVAVERCCTENGDGLYNIGGSRAVSNLELANLCVEVCRSRSVIALSGQPDAEEGIVWDVSIAKAGSHIGYTPVFSLIDSIRDLAAELLVH